MKSASNTLPDEPPNGVTAGIDWARDDHAVSIVDDRGREIDRATVEHNAAGLRELLAVLGRAGVGEVAIERPDGPVVDTLLGAGITVVVISPNQVKNLRGRYGSAGNKDDRFDAFVLADTLRTDRARLRAADPRQPGHRRPAPDLPRPQGPRRPPGRGRQPAPRPPAATSSPARSGCSPTSTPRSAWRSWPASTPRTAPTGSPPKRLAAWLASVGYCGRTDPAVLHARLTAAPRGATGDRRRRPRPHHPRPARRR